MVGDPKIDTRPAIHTMGIRIQTPMSGLSGQMDKLFRELNNWIKSRGIVPAGPLLRRFYIIDMKGKMDIEAAIPVAAPMEADGRVEPRVLPAGRYASLIYTGSGLTGNKTLIEWARGQGLEWDRWDDPNGDAFRCR